VNEEEHVSMGGSGGVCYQLQRVMSTGARSDSFVPQYRSPESVEKNGECEQSRTSKGKEDLLMSTRTHFCSYHSFMLLDRSFMRALSSQVLVEKGPEEGKFDEVSPAESSPVEASFREPDTIDSHEEDASEATVVEEEEESGNDLDDVSLKEEQSSVDESQRSLWRRIQKAKLAPWKSIMPVVKRWIAEGHGLDKRAIISTMIRLRRLGRYKQALEISDWMVQQEGVQWGEMDHVVQLELKAKMGQFRNLEALFRNAPPELKTQAAYHTLLKGYVDSEKSDKAEATFAEFKASGLLTHSFAFNQMLLLYKSKGSMDKIPKLLEEMKTMGIARDVYTYNILMDWKAQSGDIVGMEQIFEELKADEGVKPDAATYGTLASTYVKSGDLVKAKVFLHEMEEGDVIRRRAAYDILLAQYSTIGDYEAVERVWAKSKSLPGISTSTYVTMLEALGKLGKVERAEEIYKVLTKEKGLALGRQYNAMLSVYTRQGLMEQAEAVVEEMEKRGRKRTSITYHHLVNGYLKNLQLDKALETVAKAQAESTFNVRTKPWLVTMDAILNGCAERGDVVLAERHFGELRKLYPKVDVQKFNMLLKAYIVGQVPASGFLQRMQADNIFPNDETLSLLKQQVEPSDGRGVSQRTVEP